MLLTKSKHLNEILNLNCLVWTLKSKCSPSTHHLSMIKGPRGLPWLGGLKLFCPKKLNEMINLLQMHIACFEYPSYYINTRLFYATFICKASRHPYLKEVWLHSDLILEAT